MNTNITKSLDELKTIVIALHRSAGELDDLIQIIETELSDNRHNGEYVTLFIKSYLEYRKKFKAAKGYSELDEMEADIWARLLTDTREES